MSLPDAQQLATKWGTPLHRDPASQNLTTTHDSATIWLADRTTLDTLRATARHLGLTPIALWRLGLEDPALWSHDH
jgi:hypothetical protein